jgi:hypothetical protein
MTPPIAVVTPPATPCTSFQPTSPPQNKMLRKKATSIQLAFMEIPVPNMNLASGKPDVDALMSRLIDTSKPR